MPKEKEGFREQLQALMDRFPGRDVIDIKEAAEVVGVHRETLLHDPSFPSIKFGSPKGNGPRKVALVQFARWLCAVSAPNVRR